MDRSTDTAVADDDAPLTRPASGDDRELLTPPGDYAHPLTHPQRAALELSAVLHALSDPMRLHIVAELAAEGGERTCNSFNLPIVKSTCTHHFKVLRDAGLIHQRLVGTKRVNTLRRGDLEARFPGLLDAVLRGAKAQQVA